MTEQRRTAWVAFRCCHTGRRLGGKFVSVGEGWYLEQLIPSSDLSPGAVPEGVADLAGYFGIIDGYKGCPDCRAGNYVKCGACQGMCCYDTSWGKFSCHWCGNSGLVSGSITSMNAQDMS